MTAKPLRILLAMLALVGASLALCAPARADSADIEAAARGVVRVVIVGRDGDEIFPVSHGTGFSVGGERIVTNAHVVREAIEDERLMIGIVPPEGGDAVYARLLTTSPRNDLALLQTTEPMNLPPLTIAGNPPSRAGAVVSIGYPMNVDRAQGLGANDIFRATPPVTSTGFLSGRRPSREFDTLLHTAPIARGNSGGPLVDECGRLVGVNSFGAESEGTEAEFFFAVSTRELLPFLRANGVQPRINSLPCRSLEELEAAEYERAERRRDAEEARAAAEEETRALRTDQLRRELTFAVIEQRADLTALALLAAMVALAAVALAAFAHTRGDGRLRAIAGSVALLALAGALVAWLSRPGFAEIENRLEESLRSDMEQAGNGAIPLPAPARLDLACTLDTQRSRIVSVPEEAMPLEWDAQGCVNGRSQYGLSNGTWERVFVPAREEAVSVSRFDPQAREFTVERYLLDRNAMIEARAARGSYSAPGCDAGEQAARALGEAQRAILSALPERPNERLVYDCAAPQGGAQ